MGSIASRIEALEARIAGVEQEVANCVAELRVDDGGRFLVAERLPRLGTAILPHVHRLLAELSLEGEVRVLAALSGLAVGDEGPSLVALFDEIEHGGELAPLAARTMAKRGVPGVGAASLTALRSLELSDVDSAVMLLEAIRDSSEVLTEADRERLESSARWQIVTAVREFFPEPESSGE